MAKIIVIIIIIIILLLLKTTKASLSEKNIGLRSQRMRKTTNKSDSSRQGEVVPFTASYLDPWKHKMTFRSLQLERFFVASRKFFIMTK